MRNELNNNDINPFKAIRDKHNLTWKDVPKILGMSYVTAREVEKGQIVTPRKYAMELERVGLIDSAVQIMADHQAWLEREKERATREFFNTEDEPKKSAPGAIRGRKD